MRFVALSALIDGAAPVTEFRIWRAGLNPDRNGPGTLFDEKAATAVMASQAEHGVLIPFDLEHLSLADDAVHYDPDARGWCKLEVRRDTNGGPELWAFEIAWTPDGLRRLTEGTQRYPSPAFFFDADNRPTRVLNIGLVAHPATDHAPLLAASERHTRMSVSLIAAAAAGALVRKLNAAGIAPGTIIKTLAEDGDSAGEAAGVNIGELALAFGIDIDPGSDPAGFIKAILSKLDEVRSKLSGDAPEPASEPAADVPPSEEMAAAKEVLRMLGASTLVTSLATLSEWRTLAIEHADSKAKLAAEQKALTASKYITATVRQVTSGAELPATAWADDAKTKPALHILSQSLEQLEVRAKAFESARGATNAGTRLQPAGELAHGLTATELATCSAKKIDPAKFAANKAALAARTARPFGAPKGADQ